MERTSCLPNVDSQQIFSRSSSNIYPAKFSHKSKVRNFTANFLVLLKLTFVVFYRQHKSREHNDTEQNATPRLWYDEIFPFLDVSFLSQSHNVRASSHTRYFLLSSWCNFVTPLRFVCMVFKLSFWRPIFLLCYQKVFWPFLLCVLVPPEWNSSQDFEQEYLMLPPDQKYFRAKTNQR